MLQSRRARVAALMALLGVLGCAATAGAPDGTHYAGLWPVGLGSGILIYARPNAQRLVPLALLLGAVILAALALGGYPWDVSFGYAVGITSECLVVHQVLTGRWGGRRLSDDRDLVRFAAACLVGALVGALVFGLTSAVTDFGRPGAVAVAVFIIHLTSQLILLGLFMEELRHPGFGGRAERSIRWSLALAMTVAAFVPTTVPSLVFLVLPLIGWTALRAPMREALWQLLIVCCIAASLTSLGYGPFVSIYAIHDRSPELVSAPLQGFMLACALVCIPFAMAVGRQRRSATEADHERERLRRIVEGAIGTVIIESDPVGRITLFNPGAQAILGYSEEEVLGRTPAMFFTDEEIARHAVLLGVPPDLMQVSLASSLPENGPRDWNYQAKDGQVRTLSANVVPITDNNHQVVGYLATGDDITKRAGAQIALETALAAERKAVANLTEVDRTKDAFVSSVSHELRTPITNIVGYLELLLDGAYGATTATQHEALGRIDTNSHRLLELIDDLLTLSQIESLDVELSSQPVDLREVVRRVASEIRHDLVARGQQLQLELPAEPAVVHGDQAHLQRMVSNLATNAVKFTPHGGIITLRVATAGTSYAIEVQDTGVGIPDEEQALLFNRFFRSSYAQTEAIQGSGLGLSIARSIAQRHGARISATSRVGRGSVFTVSFERQPAVDGWGAPTTAQAEPVA